MAKCLQVTPIGASAVSGCKSAIYVGRTEKPGSRAGDWVAPVHRLAGEVVDSDAIYFLRSKGIDDPRANGQQLRAGAWNLKLLGLFNHVADASGGHQLLE